MQYLHEFLMLTLIHLLAVMSPGPDFAVVVRQSISFDRKTALITSLGIGAGIGVHMLYTLFGLGFIITQSKIGFLIAQLVGICYLSFLAFNLIRSKPQSSDGNEIALDNNPRHHKKAFMLGLMTNVLNPKATLFFLAIFTTVVSLTTPFYVQTIYAVWIIFTTVLWFSLVSFFFSQKSIRAKFVKHGYIFERVMGSVLLLFAIKLIWGLIYT
ncbi:lysine transporter LysE [Psychromonas marina]|uniref:Lysine transporter LysE n=1 Tax=Psychromonas marina TaxID=88364 RepID=A0ABQ6E0M7_9GAMM|nr:LysE family translocator [Psychromonas marina]GLS90872.1 lysine transporter LysE [Psychromonas marina]